MVLRAPPSDEMGWRTSTQLAGCIVLSRAKWVSPRYPALSGHGRSFTTSSIRNIYTLLLFSHSNFAARINLILDL